MRSQFVRFAVVGAIGFAVDAGLMQLLFTAGWHPFAARAVSFPAALACTFGLNRAWSFGGLRMAVLPAYGAYGAIQLLGAAINLIVFAACLYVAPLLYRHPVVALAIGAAAALFFNFYAARRFVFRA